MRGIPTAEFSTPRTHSPRVERAERPLLLLLLPVPGVYLYLYLCYPDSLLYCEYLFVESKRSAVSRF